MDTPFKVISLDAIRSGLKRPSLGMALFLIGLNCLFFLPLLYPKALYQGAQAGTYRYYFLSWLLISAGGIMETVKHGFWLIRRKPFWALVVVTSLALMTTQGLLEGEPLYSILYKTFPFYWLLFVPAIGVHERNWSWIWLTFFLHVTISILYSFNAFFIQGATSRIAIVQLSGQNFLAESFYMSAVLFLMLPVMRGRIIKGVTLALLGAHLLLSLFFFSRLAWFLLPVQLCMLLYISFRERKLLLTLPKTIFSLLLLGIAFGVIWVAFNDSSIFLQIVSSINNAFAGLTGRFLEKGTLLDTVLQNERWYESRVVITSMKNTEWLFGKGLAARWSAAGFAQGEIRYMVHNTWLNAFYWGGIPLFLAITIPLIWTFRVLLRFSNVEALCCAAYLLVTYLTFPFYLRTTISLEWVPFCLFLGVCVWYDSSARYLNMSGTSRLSNMIH